MCIKPIEVIELQNNLNNVLEIVQNMDKRIEDLNNDIRNCDLEVLDLMHKIELSNFNASQGYLLSRELKNVSIRRREAKNNVSIIVNTRNKFKNMFKQNDSNLAINFIDSIDGQIKAMSDRKYKPRIREDLFIK